MLLPPAMAPHLAGHLKGRDWLFPGPHSPAGWPGQALGNIPRQEGGALPWPLPLSLTPGGSDAALTGLLTKGPAALSHKLPPALSSSSPGKRKEGHQLLSSRKSACVGHCPTRCCSPQQRTSLHRPRNHFPLRRSWTEPHTRPSPHVCVSRPRADSHPPSCRLHRHRLLGEPGGLHGAAAPHPALHAVARLPAGQVSARRRGGAPGQAAQTPATSWMSPRT